MGQLFFVLKHYIQDSGKQLSFGSVHLPRHSNAATQWPKGALSVQDAIMKGETHCSIH